MKRTRTGRATRSPYVIPPQASAALIHRLLNLTGTVGPFQRDLIPWSKPLPMFGSSKTEFAMAYLEAEILSKYDDGTPSPLRTEETWRRFYAAEEQCRLTNEFLRKERSSTRIFRVGDGQQILHSAALKIQSILGDFSWDDAERYFGWGPGASTRLTRRQSSASYKYSGRPDTTSMNAALANACIMRSPLWQEGLTFEEDSGYCNIVPGNRIVTVPKNYKTDRTIAIEPDMNMYVQKGIGGLIRRRLRRWGIDLDDQSRNQRLARIGSIAGTLATIDMSMASDTISYELVSQLLPSDWWHALGQCRSPVGILPSGEVISYQKFSSMGNGYTFELETLIFYALALAVSENRKEKDRRIAVYGDDLIVPSAMVPEMLSALTYSGFTPNTKKTHTSGPFRESCGKHYLSGYDVTPFYIKRPIKRLTDLFLFHNQIYRWCKRLEWSDSLPLEELFSLVRDIRRLAPAVWRKPRIPDGLGDGAFVGTFDECTPSRAPHQLEGFVVKHLAPVTEKADVDLKGRFLDGLVNIRGQSLSSRGGPCNYIVSVGQTRKIVSASFTLDDVARGGVSQPPRLREVRTLVVQFAGLNPFRSDLSPE